MSTDATSIAGAPRRASGQNPNAHGLSRRNLLLSGTTLAAASAFGSAAPVRTAPAQAQPAAQAGDKPNFLVIYGDDIGITNISAFSQGLMGYHTPNIDRIAREGVMFLHYYGEQSCTAGRAAFLTGQHGIRTGLTKVGFPGAPMGMSQLDPSIGGLLKNLGYATGQFGKNHVGDRNETLPTVNGFDEFFGNLYHLNAEEEPELPDYPKDPSYLARFGPRGVLRCKASDIDDPTARARNSSTSTTTAISSACATRTGRSCSWSSARPAPWRCGPSRSRRCACPSFSTCAPIRTSGRTSRPTPYWDWMFDHAFIVYGAQAGVARFLETFKEFPPSQRPATFTIDQAMEKLQQSIGPN